MNYKIINGAVSYGADTILEEINFEIKDKDKIAIVGRNGSGKTTLLKTLIDNDMLEQGVGEAKFGVYKQGSPVLGYLKQIQFEDTDATLVEEIIDNTESILTSPVTPGSVVKGASMLVGYNTGAVKIAPAIAK